MTPLTFNANSPELLALKEWWDDLGKSPGPRAELRRCGDLQEAALATGTQDLCLKLKCGFGDLARVGAIAALASHIKEKEPRRLAEAFAGGGEDPALSELRFRRLKQECCFLQRAGIRYGQTHFVQPLLDAPVVHFVPFWVRYRM